LRLPELRQLFKEVFGKATTSNNIEWLRRKLSEAPDASQGRGRHPSAWAAAPGVSGDGGASAGGPAPENPTRAATDRAAVATMPAEQLQFYAEWAAHLAAADSSSGSNARAQGLVAGTLEPAVQQQLCPPPLPWSWSQPQQQLRQATPALPPFMSQPLPELQPWPLRWPLAFDTAAPLVPLARTVSAPAAAMAWQRAGADGSWSSGGCGLPPAALYAAEAPGAATAFVCGSQMATAGLLPPLELLMQGDTWATVDASPLTPQECSIGTSSDTATGQPVWDAASAQLFGTGGFAAGAPQADASARAICDGVGVLWTDAGLGALAQLDEIMGSNDDDACSLGSLLEGL
jgi:hypothetical protein